MSDDDPFEIDAAGNRILKDGRVARVSMRDARRARQAGFRSPAADGGDEEDSTRYRRSVTVRDPKGREMCIVLSAGQAAPGFARRNRRGRATGRGSLHGWRRGRETARPCVPARRAPSAASAWAAPVRRTHGGSNAAAAHARCRRRRRSVAPRTPSQHLGLARLGLVGVLPQQRMLADAPCRVVFSSRSSNTKRTASVMEPNDR
jgi:hypothetical protein